MSEDNRRLAAIMFTDMVGYSALVHKNERLANQIQDEHNAILRESFSKHRGKEIKSTGDGFLVEFSTALDAVKCALEVQSSLQTHNLGVVTDEKIQIRIGIHLGEVEEKDGDIFGDGVNIASRIEGLCEPGGIAVSEAVYFQVENRFDTPLISLGKQALKNIDKPLEVYRVSLPWQKNEQDAVDAKAKGKRTDARLKYGSFVAVTVIAIIAVWFLWQSISTPSSDEWPLITSVGVLPCEDYSPNRENDYFGEGIAEDLRYSLSKIGILHVPSRTSSFSETLKGLPIREIASRLVVESILECTVTKTENQIEITAQLIRTFDDSILWSGEYDGPFEEILEIQEKIVVGTAETLGVEDLSAALARPTDNPEAYNLYLLGRFHWNKRDKQGFLKAIEYFEEAIALDPDFALAYVGMADAYAISADRAFISRDSGFEKAENLAWAALELNENLAEAYATLGIINQSYHGNIEKAEEYYQRAIEIDPNYATAHHWYRILLREQLNRGDEAFAHAERARELDPLSPIILFNYAVELRYEGRLDDALIETQRVFEINPEFPPGNLLIDLIYHDRGDWYSGEENYLSAINRFPNNGNLHRNLAWHYLYRRDFEMADKEILKAIELLPQPITKSWRGYILTMSQQYEEATKVLEDVLTLDDKHFFSWERLAWAYYFASEYAKGREAIESGLKLLHPSNRAGQSMAKTLQGAYLAVEGKKAEAQQIMLDLQGRNLFIDDFSPLQIAIVYAALDDAANTVIWLEKAAEGRGFWWPQLNVHPIFEHMRDEPEIEALLGKLGWLDE